MSKLIDSFNVPGDVRKKTNLASTQFYERLDIYDNKMVGVNNGNEQVSWFYKDYNNIQVVDANLNSQFARIVFVTSANGNQKEIALSTTTNLSIQGDLNKVLFCSGMFSYAEANKYAKKVFDVLYKAFNNYKESKENNETSPITMVSSADEIKKYKELLDIGAITQEEFVIKKKQLLGLEINDNNNKTPLGKKTESSKEEIEKRKLIIQIDSKSNIINKSSGISQPLVYIDGKFFDELSKGNLVLTTELSIGNHEFLLEYQEGMPPSAAWLMPMGHFPTNKNQKKKIKNIMISKEYEITKIFIGNSYDEFTITNYNINDDIQSNVNSQILEEEKTLSKQDKEINKLQKENSAFTENNTHLLEEIKTKEKTLSKKDSEIIELKKELETIKNNNQELTKKIKNEKAKERREIEKKIKKTSINIFGRIINFIRYCIFSFFTLGFMISIFKLELSMLYLFFMLAIPFPPFIYKMLFKKIKLSLKIQVLIQILAPIVFMLFGIITWGFMFNGG